MGQQDIRQPEPLRGYPLHLILFRASDLRRVRETILNKKTDFIAYVKPSSPTPPILTQGFRFELKLSTNISDCLLLAVFMSHDTWTNTWTPCLEIGVPAQDVSNVYAYITEIQEYEKIKNNFKQVKTNISDYLSMLHMKITNNIQNYNKRICTPSDTFIKNNFGNIDIYLNAFDLTSVNRYTNRIDRGTQIASARKLTKAHTKRNKLPLTVFMKLLHRLLSDEAAGRVQRFNTAIYYSNRTTQIEIDYEGTTPEQLTPGNEIIPKRLFGTNHIRNCICCEKNTFVENIYHIELTQEEVKEFFYKRVSAPKENKPFSVVTSKEEPVIALAGVPASNKVTASIKDILNNSLNKVDFYKKGTTTIPSQPYISHSGYVSNKIVATTFALCMSCFNNVYRTPVSPVFNIVKTFSRTDYMKEYTDNPLKYFKQNPDGTHRLALNEKPNIRTIVLTPRTSSQHERVYIDETLYMGVELEVTANKFLKTLVVGAYKNQNYLARDSKDFGALLVDEFLLKERIGIIKKDGSIEDRGGFEIVSVPGTHRWHLEEAWNKFFKENYSEPEASNLAPSALIAGWHNNGQTQDTPLCGMHVHVSKAFFSQLGLGKLLQFFGEASNKSFIEDIAGRKENNYTKFYKKKISQGRIAKDVASIRTRDNIPGFFAERGAINVNTGGKPTIEFRIFRSNVSKQGFFKNLDFVHAMSTWCNYGASTTGLNTKEFIKYCESNRGTYKYLTKWFIKKGYIKDIIKPNPEFIKGKVIDLETGLPIIQLVPNPGYQPEHEEAA